MWESECLSTGASRSETEDLEVLVLREERGKVGEAFSRTLQIIESERGEILPASARVEVVRDGGEPGTTWDKVRHVKILQQIHTMRHGLKCGGEPLGLGNS